MRKKMLSLALALVMCLGLALPASAYGMGKAGENSIVSAGSIHTGFIDQNGSLWMWGVNNYGQLGNGSEEDSLVPVKVMDNVTAVSCGGWHTAAIKTDGSLWMWGNNYEGQLGNGDGADKSNTSQTTPVKVMDNVAAVSCGNNHTAAIKTDGSLWMWGDNDYGQLGNGGQGDKSIWLGLTVAGSSGGSGHWDPIQTVPVKVMDNVAAVSCNFGYSCTAAIKTDGSLWMWGDNTFGQLGNGSEEDSNTPVKVMDGVAAVSCGYSHAAAVKTDGTLWTWGRNAAGALGTGSAGDVSFVPMKVMDNVTAVSCGDYHTAVIKSDRSLWIWGENSEGQLGNGAQTREASYVPLKVMDGVAVVSCGTDCTAAVKTDGSLWMWGTSWKGQLGNGGQGNTMQGGRPIQTVPAQIAGLTAAVSATAPTLPAPGTATNGFSDVKTTDFFAEPVAWAVEQGITVGTSTMTFSPNATCTQGQILTFLWRAKGEPKPAGTVSGTQYYAAAAQWAREQGLTGNFSAETDCTRAMVVTYLWKLAGSPKTGTSNFSDVSVNADYAQAVAWAVEQGITSGVGNGQFAPNSACTRGQIVTFLYRAFAK